MIQRDAIQAALDSPEIPPVIAAWCAQLLSPEVISLLHQYPSAQVDVRLSASKGRVRRNPVVIFNAGPSDMVEP